MTKSWKKIYLEIFPFSKRNNRFIALFCLQLICSLMRLEDLVRTDVAAELNGNASMTRNRWNQLQEKTDHRHSSKKSNLRQKFKKKQFLVKTVFLSIVLDKFSKKQQLCDLKYSRYSSKVWKNTFLLHTSYFRGCLSKELKISSCPRSCRKIRVITQKNETDVKIYFLD